MNDNDTWLEILARISPNQPVDLDPILTPNDTGAAGSGNDVLTYGAGLTENTPSTMLWHEGDGENAYIGVKVTEQVKNVHVLAVKLAAAAAERHVIPIILSSCADSGFERFGFRVERLSGDAATQNLMQAQLCSFWDMAIVIDIDQVSSLG